MNLEWHDHSWSVRSVSIKYNLSQWLPRDLLEPNTFTYYILPSFKLCISVDFHVVLSLTWKKVVSSSQFICSKMMPPREPQHQLTNRPASQPCLPCPQASTHHETGYARCIKTQTPRGTPRKCGTRAKKLWQHSVRSLLGMPVFVWRWFLLDDRRRLRY